MTEARGGITEKPQSLADGGMPPGENQDLFDPASDRFIERRLCKQHDRETRFPADFPNFEEFVKQTAIHEDTAVETQIASITELGEKTVYDIGVEQDAHNFVANGFVVSNCGVRMLKTTLTYDDIRGHEEELVDELFDRIPSGLGAGGVVETDRDTINEILNRGMDWALENGFAIEKDLEHCEDQGVREESAAQTVSQEAKDRGSNQVGSLGSGNHFLEVQRVTDIYREDVADAYGLTEDQIVVLIHCGSRGLGHQVCTDYLRKIEQTHQGLLNELPDKELAAAPAGSQLAEMYYAAMGCAINFAWVNRQLVMYRTREV
ncbi:MAG: RtcB family protein, partial [Halobacteriaceae archaeon]